MVNAVRRHPRRKFQLLIGAALLLLIGYWILQQVVWIEKEIDLGHSAAARKDPFLAARHFLQRQNVASQTLRSFSLLEHMRWQGETLGADDTLVLVNSHKLLNGARLGNLIAWVEAGGTVIASTDNPFIGNNTGTRDRLLEYFDLYVVDDTDADSSADDESAEEEGSDENYDESADAGDDEDLDPIDKAEPMDGKNENDKTPTADKPLDADEADGGKSAKDGKLSDEALAAEKFRRRCNMDIEHAPLTLAGEANPLIIDYSEGRRFDYISIQPDAEIGDDQGLNLARFDWGQGAVIVNSDPSIWTNDRIDCHDHAYALWKLINPNGKVWFLINQEAPSLWVLLWRAAPAGITAAVMALALWLWAKAVRFGPVLSKPNTGRRSLAEHIQASTALHWRRQQHPYLVTQLRTDLRVQLRQLNPLFERDSEKEQIQYLSALSGLGEAQVLKALFSDQLQSPQDFTEAVAFLQTIRKNL
jgi:hypothetical protein